MNKIETRSETIWITEEGLMYYEAKSIERHLIEDARENMEAGKTLLNGRPAALSVIDIRKARFVSSEARNLYISKENKELIKACALLVGSPVSKILGNFFLGINKGSFPTRLFTSEEDALIWLKKHEGE